MEERATARSSTIFKKRQVFLTQADVEGNGKMERQMRMVAVGAALMMTAGTILSGCGASGSSTPPPVPNIQNINSSTTPTSPVNLPIEINGSGFQAAPGKVVFTQGSITAPFVPSTSGWSDTGIVAVVPAGNGTTNV